MDSVLLATLPTGATVTISADAGSYYCKHALFALHHAARRQGSSVLRGRHGPLVGFLHVPDAVEDYAPHLTAHRHRDIEVVVAAAIRGFLPDLIAQTPQPRLLLTGFGPFKVIVNNPTGAFVTRAEALSRSFASALGIGLPPASTPPLPELTRFVATARAAAAPEHAPTWAAISHTHDRDPALTVFGLRLPTTDQAIDPRSRGSLHHAIAALRPHAVIAMGVVSDLRFEDRVFRAETHADDRLLRRTGGHWRHDPTRLTSTRTHCGHALVHALRAGFVSGD